MSNDNVVHIDGRARASNPVAPDEKIISVLEDALSLAKEGKVHSLGMVYNDESNAGGWVTRHMWRGGTFERTAMIVAGLNMISFEIAASMSECAEDVDED